TSHLSLWRLGYMLQIAFVYWFAALLKWRDLDWQSGVAVAGSLMISTYSRPLGRYMLQFPGVLRLLTKTTLWFEAFGPFLLFGPGPVKMLGVFSFMALHLGFAVSLALGPFPWTSMVTVIGFLPGEFWDKVLAYFGRLKSARLKVYY